MQNFSYLDYVTDDKFMTDYNEYQKKYAKRIRESDRIVLDMVDELLKRSQCGEGDISLVDVGCSTGNLLLHLRHRFPTFSLKGGEMAESALKECRENPDLAGISFEKMNLVDLPIQDRFDFMVINAVLYLFNDDDYDRCLMNVSRALKPGGWLIAFDFFHRFEQELAILEKSETHPSGLMLHFRSYKDVLARLDKQNLGNATFSPFKIPIDLPEPQADSDMISYTRSVATGDKLLFRGSLFQPWCHLSAQKTSVEPREDQ